MCAHIRTYCQDQSAHLRIQRMKLVILHVRAQVVQCLDFLPIPGRGQAQPAAENHHHTDSCLRNCIGVRTGATPFSLRFLRGHSARLSLLSLPYSAPSVRSTGNLPLSTLTKLQGPLLIYLHVCTRTHGFCFGCVLLCLG